MRCMDRALLLTGPLGSGKTSVAVEAGWLLDEAGVPNAVVDLDWLCWIGPGITGERLVAVLADNLAAVVARFRAEGVGAFVLARTVASAQEIERVRAALGPGTSLTSVRLEVPPEVTAQRLRERDDPADLAQQAGLTQAVAALTVDLEVANHGRTARATAAEVLARARWAPAVGGDG